MCHTSIYVCLSLHHLILRLYRILLQQSAREVTPEPKRSLTFVKHEKNANMSLQPDEADDMLHQRMMQNPSRH
jgi:hypothetical protein